MKVIQALAQARDALDAGNIEDATLESNLLLRHILNISPAQLYLDFDRELSSEQQQAYWQLVQRRISGEPSAYITGHREFYGIDYYVDSRVLIPRPETELLVERAIQLVRSRAITSIADIGTGCGAIAISLALNLPGVKIYATDISAAALDVARLNCRKLGVAERITLLQGSLLDPLPESVDLIVANLPYVKVADLPDKTAEPVPALDGGMEGLDKIYELGRQVAGKLITQGCLLLEIGMGQSAAAVSFLRALFPAAQIEVFKDLAGIERVVSLCRV